MSAVLDIIFYIFFVIDLGLELRQEDGA